MSHQLITFVRPREDLRTTSPEGPWGAIFSGLSSLGQTRTADQFEGRDERIRSGNALGVVPLPPDHAGAYLYLADPAAARFVRSSEAHARLLALDAAPALAVPGVVRVLTGADLRTTVGDIPWIRRPPEPGAELPGRSAPPAPLPPLRPLAGDTVRWVGEPIAMVLGGLRCQAGVKGIGESGAIGSTPAVANAVNDALRQAGVPHLDLPLTPERIWTAPASRTPSTGMRADR